MSDSEKLTALKKAYADIILNTAKEAAARIMVSERKAIRYQQELFTAKDDALRMLLRLKQMLDDKANEAQVTSLRQQRKIEELEAQLGEAEDIVRDLRAELREAHDQLEKATTNQMQLLDEQNSNGDVATLVTTSSENKLNSSETMASSLSNPPSELLVTTSDVRNSTLSGKCESNKCHGEICSHKDNCYYCNADFASIAMRRKEPKLYWNGCTQRIHAFERNLLDENLSLPGQVDDVKNRTSIGEDEEDMHKNLDPRADNMCGVESNPTEFKMMKGISVHAAKSFQRKRKRAVRRKKSKTLSFRKFPDQVAEKTQEFDLSCPNTVQNAVLNNVQHEEDSKILENKVEKDPESPSVLQLLSDTVTTSGLEFQITSNGKLMIDTLDLTRQESGTKKSHEVPACKSDLETINASLVNSDFKTSSLTEEVTTQPLSDKLIKYTFQRKRKRESFSSPDRDSSVDRSVMKRKMGEGQNGSLESQNSSLITESSRDSRRLAQVARQLISLSEKQW